MTDDVRGPPAGTWVPTPAHLRAVVMALGCLVTAVVGRRPDMAILGASFVAVAGWGRRHRPGGTTTSAIDVEARTLFEGQTTKVRVTTTSAAGADGVRSTGDVLAAALATGPWFAGDPPGSARAVASGGGAAVAEVPVRALRWGRHEIALMNVMCTSRLGAFRTVGSHPSLLVVTTMPRSVDFAAVDAMPRPAGLVGLHRSRRQGAGSEPAEVRPFRPGDRLRRINWAVSSRTGALHVTSTWSDRDAHVILLLDTEHDIGVSEGVDGLASSLDISVRAAAAIGEHYLRAGDRVSVIDLGRRVRDVPPGSGRRHLRRLFEVLVAATPGANHAEALRIRPIAAGALVVALTPLVGRAGPAQVARLVQRGHTVVVIDTLPETDEARATTWEGVAKRLRALERAADVDRLGELGVPVVRWRGRGTLDEVLRDVSRMASAPRVR